MEILLAAIAPGKSKLVTALDVAGLPKLWDELSGYCMKLVHLKNRSQGRMAPPMPVAPPQAANKPSIFRSYKG